MLPTDPSMQGISLYLAEEIKSLSCKIKVANVEELQTTTEEWHNLSLPRRALETALGTNKSIEAKLTESELLMRTKN